MFWQQCTPESQNHALSGMLIPGFQDCCPPFSFATTCRKRHCPCTCREALEKPTLFNMQILFLNGKNWHMFTLKPGMNAVWEPGDILLVCGSSHHPTPRRPQNPEHCFLVNGTYTHERSLEFFHKSLLASDLGEEIWREIDSRAGKMKVMGILR